MTVKTTYEKDDKLFDTIKNQVLNNYFAETKLLEHNSTTETYLVNNRHVATLHYINGVCNRIDCIFNY